MKHYIKITSNITIYVFTATSSRHHPAYLLLLLLFYHWHYSLFLFLTTIIFSPPTETIIFSCLWRKTTSNRLPMTKKKAFNDDDHLKIHSPRGKNKIKIKRIISSRFPLRKSKQSILHYSAPPHALTALSQQRTPLF